MVCPNCGVDNPAEASSCAGCGQALPRACPRCGTLNPASARFCMQCGLSLVPEAVPASPLPAGAEASGAGAGTTLADLPAAPDATPAGTRNGRPARAAPAPAVLVAEQEALGEERRIVTVLFADLASSTQMAESMDPEDLRALLAAYFATMARELRRHGGTVEKYIGDAVMAVFGAPAAHEDDPVRALRAALDMRAALRRFNEERQAADPAAGALHMRIGINTGEVAAASGPEAAEGHDFLITGEAVNVAARLQEVASPDSILIGPRTYRGTRGAVRYSALPPVYVRGKRQPIHVWEALGMVDESAVPRPRPRGLEGVHAPLVGRDAELALLRAIYTRTVRERRPHRVTVLGAPGVGKTRLAREFVERLLGNSASAGDEASHGGALEAPLILEGRCPPYGEGITYWPLVEMLRAYAGVSALDAPELTRERLLAAVTEALRGAERPEDPALIAAYLGHTIGVETAERRQTLLPGDAQQLQDGLFRAWRVFFEALAARRPLVILIDDVHWADDALLDLLESLIARSSEVPLLLLCPARPELLERRPDWGRGQRNDVTIGLEPLSRRDAARLVRALLPGAGIPESLREGILARAEGNPFYVEETVRMLADRGILIRAPQAPETGAGAGGAEGGDAPDAEWRVAPAWEGSSEVSDPVIPDTVQGVLAARLDLLTPEERTLLQHAAIIGRYFWIDALQALATELDRETLGTLLAALLRRDMIQESERGSDVAAPGERIYAFKHALTREVTYAAIPRVRRAHEHARMAEWLEGQVAGRGETFVELLAQHYQLYYVEGNLARSRSATLRRQVLAKVVQYLTLAAEAAIARHVTAKAERYYGDALALLAEAATPANLPTRVDLLMRRGGMRELRARGDDAWSDYREALRLWLSSGVAGGEALEAGAGSEPSGKSGTVIDTGPSDAAPAPTPSSSMAALPAPPADWAARGMRLYRLLVLLPTRHPSWFREPPPHEELRAYLQRGLDLADRLGQRDTLDGAALLTAKSFFWWSWPEQRGEQEMLDALRSAREAVRITEALGDAHGASEALDALGNMQATTTDLRGHLESQARRLYWARQIDDPAETVDIQAEVSAAFQMVGEYQLAVEHAREALALADAAENDVLRLQALQAEVLAYCEWEHWSEALRAGDRLVALAGRVTTISNHERWAMLALAIVRVRRGQRDDGERVARLVRDLPETQETQYIGVSRGRLALARGALGEARRIFLAALDYRPGHHILAALLAELAELGARLHDPELLERFGAPALELGWRSGARKALAQAIRARGIVAVAEARWDDAEADLRNALKRYTDLGTAWEAARTRYALAGLARRRGAAEDETLARDELKEALALFEPLHAVRDIARVRAALAGGEVRVP